MENRLRTSRSGLFSILSHVWCHLLNQKGSRSTWFRSDDGLIAGGTLSNGIAAATIHQIRFFLIHWCHMWQSSTLLGVFCLRWRRDNLTASIRDKPDFLSWEYTCNLAIQAVLIYFRIWCCWLSKNGIEKHLFLLVCPQRPVDCTREGEPHYLWYRDRKNFTTFVHTRMFRRLVAERLSTKHT